MSSCLFVQASGQIYTAVSTPLADAAFPTVNPPQGLRGATAALHPSLSSSWARTARRDRRKDCALGLPQRGPAPVRPLRRDRRRRMPLSPLQTLRGVSVGLLSHIISGCPPRGLGLHAGIAARISPSDCRSADPRRCAGPVAGGCRFPHRPPYAGSLWGSCRSASLAVFLVGPDCTPGSPQGLRLRTAAARACAGAP